MPPTLPKPCTATRAVLISIPRWRAASTPTVYTPRPVASRRPQRAAQINRFAGHHARCGGAFVHGVSVHHPRHRCSLVFTSGAGMSLDCPMMMPISLV